MRPTISGLVAAFAVMTVGRLRRGWRAAGMAPARRATFQPRFIRAVTAAAAGVSGFPIRLQQYGYPAPQHLQQYYHVNQGPTYTGPVTTRLIRSMGGRGIRP